MIEKKTSKPFEKIVQDILEKIKSRELRSGDRLPPERKLAELMGVSRTVIREALRSLEAMGYIEQRIGDGTYIRLPSTRELFVPLIAKLVNSNTANEELIEARLVLETSAVALAAQNRTQEQLRQLKDNLKESTKNAEAGGFGIEQDFRFHKLLVDATGNQIISSMFGMCADMLLRTQKITQKISGQTEATIRDHKELVDAIEAQDSEVARKLMYDHLTKAKANLRSESLHE